MTTPTQAQIEAAAIALSKLNAVEYCPTDFAIAALTAAAQVGEPYYDGNIDIDREPNAMTTPTQAQFPKTNGRIYGFISALWAEWRGVGNPKGSQPPDTPQAVRADLTLEDRVTRLEQAMIELNPGLNW